MSQPRPNPSPGRRAVERETHHQRTAETPSRPSSHNTSTRQTPTHPPQQPSHQTPLRTRRPDDMSLGMTPLRHQSSGSNPRSANTTPRPRPFAQPTILPSASVPQTNPSQAGSPFTQTGSSRPSLGTSTSQNSSGALQQGVFQRIASQQINTIVTRLNAFDNHVKDMRDLKQTCDRQTQEVTSLRSTVTAQAAKILRLENQVEDIQLRRGAAAVDVDSRDSAMISRYVRLATEFLYGRDTKPPQPYPAEGSIWPTNKTANEGSSALRGAPAMRWDFTKSYTHTSNVTETTKLLTFVENDNHREAVGLPHDMPAASIPDYRAFADLYRASAARLFRTLRESFDRQAVKEWKSQGREKVLKEIKDLERVDNGTGEMAASIQERRSHLDAQDARMEKLEPNRSKDQKRIIGARLQTTLKWVKERRPLTEYASDRYNWLDHIFCLIPVVPITGTDGAIQCYWPIRDGVYSPLFQQIYDTVYNTEYPRSKLTGTSAKTDDNMSLPAEPHLPTRLTDLHKAPQRWMFCPEWLEDNQDLSDFIVPVDVPTSIEECAALDWVIRRTGIHGSATAARARSLSTQPSPSPMSFPSMPSSSNNSQGSSGFMLPPSNPVTGKRTRVLDGTPSGDEDENDEPRSYDPDRDGPRSKHQRQGSYTPSIRSPLANEPPYIPEPGPSTRVPASFHLNDQHRNLRSLSIETNGYEGAQHNYESFSKFPVSNGHVGRQEFQPLPAPQHSNSGLPPLTDDDFNMASQQGYIDPEMAKMLQSFLATGGQAGQGGSADYDYLMSLGLLPAQEDDYMGADQDEGQHRPGVGQQ
ncbi:hypothetical protein HD553DRAFT_340325 [Filobasidium floriforme]|uniref:uncharacterized protein n=1 Tax=Filobasidium floriforme TaxID=5210 RepID=UPI001E8ED989|nr:uncharacterized protein HD553DRAFT_340325 [Filobasidium floriforme]KAH8088213.1 hypothetical protein HD553DRAFT_340325 [Filobasidium floriforme]